MRALTFERFGGPEVLIWREVDDPPASPSSAIVRIDAAGLNFADIYRRRGDYHMDATPPWILGYEGAGEIVSLDATDAGGFAIGDRVGFADSPRANAEYVAVPFEKLVRLPDDIETSTAAAVLLQGLTAQYLTADSYAVKQGDLAIVHAAAGGVGLLLIQMLKAKGATVAALASSRIKRDAALGAGADNAFEYTSDWSAEIWTKFGRGADVVYDSVGSTLLQSLDASRVGGAVVFYGFAGGEPPLANPRMLMDRSLTITGGDLWNVLDTPNERRLRAEHLFSQIRTGALRPMIGAMMPMSEGADAHRLLESRKMIGKVLLTI